MNRRWLLQTVVALMLFVVWTGVVRVGISDGSRESAWIIRPFGDWPEDVHRMRGTSDLQLSIFATYASSDVTTASRGGTDFFGHPVVGPTVDSGDSEIINGSRFTTGIRAGAVSSISVFVASPVDEPPNDQFQLAIYEDSRGGPSHLLATTSSGRIVPDVWNTLAIRVVLESRTSYWLMYNTNGTSPGVNNTTFSQVEGNPLDNAIRSHGPEILSRLGDPITAVADMTPMVVAIILISLFAARSRPTAGVVLLVGFVLALLIAWTVRENILEPFGAYPSGHALRSTYVAVAFCFLVTSRVARLAAALVVLLIGVAATYTGGHYSEEVIGGVLLGWAIATGAKAFAGDLTHAPVDPAVDVGPADPSSVIDITDGSASRSQSEAAPPRQRA